MKTRPERRRFSRDARVDLKALQLIREHVRSYGPITPLDREPELAACDGLVEDLQNEILDGRRLDRVKALRQLAAVAALVADLTVTAEVEEEDAE